jgi:integrase
VLFSRFYGTKSEINTKLVAQQSFESDPWSMYIYAMKSPVTREKYQILIRKFFEHTGLRGTVQQQATEFCTRARNDNTWAFNTVIKFMQLQLERVNAKEIAGGTVRNYVKSIKLLCEMADISIPWKKITRGLPRGKRYADGRVPTVEEIKRILEYPDRRIKAIVYTMLSSGIRLGAWDHLQWGHVRPIERNACIVAAKILVYAEGDDEYYSFITEEAYRSLLQWMQYRKDSGETINDASWLMRDRSRCNEKRDTISGIWYD